MRKARSIVISLMLVLLLGTSNLGIAAAQPENSASAPKLEIQLTQIGVVGEPLTLKVVDEASGQPVAGASLYAFRPGREEIAPDEGKLPFLIQYSEFIGATGDLGEVTYTFTEEGVRLLVATRDGYVPGITVVVIKSTRSLNIQVPEIAWVGEKVEIKVVDSVGGAPVEGASVYALGIAMAEKIERWMAHEEMAPLMMPPRDWHDRVQVGTTGAEGVVPHVFEHPGRYVLVATKDGYVPGLARVIAKPAKPEEAIEVNTSRKVYFPDEPEIVFWIKNNTDAEISLPSSAPWEIIRADGTPVYSPMALQVITVLAPGESREWTWDRRDSEGKPVPPGKYLVVVRTSEGEFTAPFGIMSSEPLEIEPRPGHPWRIMLEKRGEREIIFRAEMPADMPGMGVRERLMGRVPAITSEQIFVEGSQVFVETPAGPKALKIMPGDILKTRIKARKIHRIELKVLDDKPVYEAEGTARARLFALIPLNMRIKTLLDGETGEVLKESKPWWAILCRIQSDGEVTYEEQ
jgi:predicted secreted protein